ncbi:MAG: 3-deoxy-7-phosphoheptulonate synthase [Spirochaetes bacterium]|nr:3-deoxy-7-phosphoheptulonate synthase [Spirochaetota bacterium]
MVVLVDSCGNDEIQHKIHVFQSLGLKVYIVPTSKGPVITLMGNDCIDISNISLVSRTVQHVQLKVPYVLASKIIKDTPTVITLPNGVSIGSGALVVMAGPCSVESQKQIDDAARAVKNAGAQILRGGAFKPRTSPYAFHGLGIEGLRMMRKAADREGLAIVTEVLDPEDIPIACEYADILQIGTRNCQNFSLLRKVGKTGKPILLKRGMMNTIEEFLMAAEYILSEGNMNVILCERGIRTFETETRNTLDISAIPVLKSKTHLPVIVDPSHAAGNWKLIEPLALAAVAAGADGLLIEVHPTPDTALCDGMQSLRPDKFELLMKKINRIASAMALH